MKDESVGVKEAHKEVSSDFESWDTVVSEAEESEECPVNSEIKSKASPSLRDFNDDKNTTSETCVGVGGDEVSTRVGDPAWSHLCHVEC